MSMLELQMEYKWSKPPAMAFDTKNSVTIYGRVMKPFYYLLLLSTEVGEPRRTEAELAVDDSLSTSWGGGRVTNGLLFAGRSLSATKRFWPVVNIATIGHALCEVRQSQGPRAGDFHEAYATVYAASCGTRSECGQYVHRARKV